MPFDGHHFSERPRRPDRSRRSVDWAVCGQMLCTATFSAGCFLSAAYLEDCHSHTLRSQTEPLYICELVSLQAVGGAGIVAFAYLMRGLRRPGPR